MLIEKVEDGKKFPRCPDCGVPLFLERDELSNSQKEKRKIWDECDHEFDYPFTQFAVCKKCGYRISARFIPAARLMRCPKCAALYHVEGSE